MKALIVIDNINTGGITSSLFNYLRYINSKMDCSLLVFDGKSIDINRIPKNVNIINTPKLLRVLGMNKRDLFRFSKPLYLIRGFLFILSRLINGELARKILFLFIKKIGSYDLAISYAHDDSWKSLSKGCNDFVIYKVSSKYKVSFVHCDYSHFGGYNKKQIKNYKKFNEIACVSQSCKKSFIKKFPELGDKSSVCENFIDLEDLKTKSKNAIEYRLEYVSFVTTCRLSIVKGISRTIDVFYRLYREGFENFIWVIIGDGLEYKELDKKIKSLNLDNKIKLIGEKANPYIYMKNASIFLLPSIHEAAPIVFGECCALGVPILSTETISARELVESRNLGYVCENNENGLYNAIKKILQKELDLSKYICKNVYLTNNAASEQFSKFLNRVNSNI